MNFFAWDEWIPNSSMVWFGSASVERKLNLDKAKLIPATWADCRLRPVRPSRYINWERLDNFQISKDLAAPFFEEKHSNKMLYLVLTELMYR